MRRTSFQNSDRRLPHKQNKRGDATQAAMKKMIVGLSLLIIGTAGLAQKTFTQAVLNQMLNEYKKDSKAFFVNRLSPDFRYANPNGKYFGRTDIVKDEAEKYSTQRFCNLSFSNQAIWRW